MTRRILPAFLLVAGISILVFFLTAGLARLPLEEVPDFGPLDVSFSISFAMFLPMGAFIASKRPGSPIGWLALSIGLTQIVAGGAYEYAIRALILDPGTLPLGPEMAWLSSATWAPGFSLVTFLLLLFPTGRLPSPRWKWVGWLSVASTGVVIAAISSLWPERGESMLFNEILSTPLVPEAVLGTASVILFFAIACSFVSVVVRFRRSRGIEHQQLKWMAFVATIAAVLIVATEVMTFIGESDSFLDRVFEHLLNISAAGVPIAATIAVLRYRLYDIDVIINRTLVYGGLTAVLAGTYVGLVFLFQRALAPVTQDSDVAIAASTLAVAALFRPVRGRVQAFIDHRFYRRKVDAQRTLEKFSGELRDEVDLGALSSRLTAVVAETMQPAHVSLWLRGANRLDPVTISER